MDNIVLILFFLLSCSYCIALSTSSLLQQRKFVISEEHEAARLFSTTPSPPPPITIFEVQRPIPLPKAQPCSTLVLQHDFAYTDGKPPVTSTYSPPRNCPLLRSSAPSRIVLEWSAVCDDFQDYRIFSVWLAGVELLRSCTPDPYAIVSNWSVRKDVTRYASLFSKPQTLAVYLSNIHVNVTYTGIHHVNVSFHFYFEPMPLPPAPTIPAFQSPADIIIPVSKNQPLNDGLWFQIHNSSDVQGKWVKIPKNVYRAVIEVYVSFHSYDEFWYRHPPNSYIFENNLTVPGNGPFREVTIRLDDIVVGAIWPFTVIYTGGMIDLWRPISSIGSFDLPSYDIEMTPFLGKILDGKKHFFGFGVTNSLNVWFIDANLHLWVDKNSYFTEGKLINHEAAVPTTPSLVSQFKDLDGHFDTLASRKISSTGWVKSSYGKITTHFFQNFNFTNKMKISENGHIKEVHQSINYNHGSYAKDPSSVLYYEQVFQSFPLYRYTRFIDQVNDSYSYVTNVTLGNKENKISRGKFGPYSSSNLRNSQSGQGIIHVKESTITGEVAITQQVYKYEGTDGCYFRKVGCNNYTILYDESTDYCTKSSQIGS